MTIPVLPNTQLYLENEKDRLVKNKTSLTEQQHEQLTHIERALDKIKIGSYGLCDNCGKRIRPIRLIDMPYAVHCISCSNKDKSVEIGRAN